MKRLLIIFAVLLLTVTAAYSLTYNAESNSTFFNGFAWGGHPQKDRAWQWAKEMQELTELGVQLGTGKIWFVDSGSGRSASGSGKSWSEAFLTLDEAFGTSKATANRGDVVLIAQGHNEALAAGGATIDIAGVRVYGIGEGTLTPTFDYDATTGTMIISASNVTIQNLRFRASVSAVVSGLVITGDDVTVRGCQFGYAEAPGTDEFNCAISLEDGADRCKVQGCFFNAGAAGAVQAIRVDAVSTFWLEDSDIIGDYSTACVYNNNAATEVIIRRNFLFNGTMNGDGQLNSEPGLEMANNTSGFVADNRIVSDVATALLMRVADDMVFMNNFVSDTDGDEFSGTIEAGVTLPAGTSGGIETVSSISGHIDG